MKTISVTLTITIFLVTGWITFWGSESRANQAHYFRVWQGFKKSNLTQKQFIHALPQFMQDTVGLYHRRGLNNYMVVIPPKNKPSYVPDEFALVGLTSERAYRYIRGTKAGKVYGASHWSVFEKKNSFSSRHFVDYQRVQPKVLKNNWTYDMIGKPIDWSTGHSMVYIGTRKKHLSKKRFLKGLKQHIELAKDSLSPLGMRAYIVLANENYEVAYINWASKRQHDLAMQDQRTKQVFQDADKLLQPLMYQQLRPFAAGSTVHEGAAYSTLYKGQPVSQKALIVVTSHRQLGTTGKKTGFYLSEVTHPFYALQESGIHVEIASIKGGKAPMDMGSYDLKDPMNKRFLNENASLLRNTIKLKNLDAKVYKAILFSGGHGTMWDFPDNQAVNQISRDIYENGGVVSAVCHGSAALLGIELSNDRLLIDGKRLTSFTNEEEKAVQLDQVMPFALETELTNLGAQFVAAKNWDNNVVVDGQLITGQNPASAHGVGQAIAKFLTEL